MRAYDEHADTIFRFIAMKLSDREAARDLTQETFTRAWDFVSGGGVVDQWKAFLFRTAYNLVVDTYRKKKQVSLDEMIDEHEYEPADTSETHKVDVIEMRRVRKAIDELDETYRDVVMLRFLEDLPPREIARILKLTENVVSVRLHRGVKLLKHALNTTL